MGLSNEVLCILVAQGPAKLPDFQAGDRKINPGLEPGPHSSGADRAERQNFFRPPNLTFGSFAVS